MSLVYTYDYDSDYQPAMPTAEITIGPAMVDASLTLTALLDSGADATMIPRRYLQQFRANCRLNDATTYLFAPCGRLSTRGKAVVTGPLR